MFPDCGGLVVVVAGLLFGAVGSELVQNTVQGTPAAAQVENPLAALDWLAGGKWVVAVKRPDGTTIVRESFFERGPNGRTMRFWSFVKSPSGTTPYVDGMYGWHPGEKKIIFSYFDAAGGYYSGEVRVDGNVLDHIFSGVGADGKVQQYRYTLTYGGEGKMPTRIFASRAGQWQEIVSLLYERSK